LGAGSRRARVRPTNCTRRARNRTCYSRPPAPHDPSPIAQWGYILRVRLDEAAKELVFGVEGTSRVWSARPSDSVGQGGEVAHEPSGCFVNCRAATRYLLPLSDPGSRPLGLISWPMACCAATSHPSSVAKLSNMPDQIVPTGSEIFYLPLSFPLHLRLPGQSFKTPHTGTIVSLGGWRGRGGADAEFCQGSKLVVDFGTAGPSLLSPSSCGDAVDRAAAPHRPGGGPSKTGGRHGERVDRTGARPRARRTQRKPWRRTELHPAPTQASPQARARVSGSPSASRDEPEPPGARAARRRSGVIPPRHAGPVASPKTRCPGSPTVVWSGLGRLGSGPCRPSQQEVRPWIVATNWHAAGPSEQRPPPHRPGGHSG